MSFSVLISTYHNDNPQCLKKALQSIFNQSLPPSEVVLVVDGTIKKETQEIISNYLSQYSTILKPIYLEGNVGLGNALNIGLTHCTHSLVARMDADDECFFDRFNKQVEYLTNHQDIAVVGSFVEEFITIPNDYGKIKKVPVGSENIKKYSTYRNPLNHPTVMFRKEAVEAVGSYKEINLFEDYYLWLRLLKAGYKIENLSDSLVYFKIGNDLIGRRHGFLYLVKEFNFLDICRKERLISFGSFIFLIIGRLPMRLLPKKILLFLYKNLLRHKVDDISNNNILYITTKSEVGGVQKFVQEQIDITANEFDIYLCSNQQDWLTEQVKHKTKNVLLNKKVEKKFSISFLFQLIKFIKQNKINLVITNSANAGFYGRVAAFFVGTKSCYFSHGWSSVYNGGKLSFLLNFIERLLAYISTKIICVSNNDYKIAIEKIKIPISKLVVVKNATFPVYKLSKKNNVPFSSSPLQRIEVRFKVIALARFANPKRIDLMIKSFEKITNAELHIAGNGAEFAFWKNYIAENKIKNVTLLGEVQSFAAFNKYDAFMLISNSEGLPISGIEAMSAGLPLILSNVGGCPELINGNGVLVENNIEAIQKAIENVITNYTQYQQQSVEFYNKEYNLENVKSK